MTYADGRAYGGYLVSGRGTLAPGYKPEDHWPEQMKHAFEDAYHHTGQWYSQHQPKWRGPKREDPSFPISPPPPPLPRQWYPNLRRASTYPRQASPSRERSQRADGPSSSTQRSYPRLTPYVSPAAAAAPDMHASQRKQKVSKASSKPRARERYASHENQVFGTSARLESGFRSVVGRPPTPMAPRKHPSQELAEHRHPHGKDLDDEDSAAIPHPRRTRPSPFTPSSEGPYHDFPYVPVPSEMLAHHNANGSRGLPGPMPMYLAERSFRSSRRLYPRSPSVSTESDQEDTDESRSELSDTSEEY